MSRRSLRCLSLVVMILAAGVLPAQEAGSVSSPYQAQHDYSVGERLQLAVEIDGLRWQFLQIAPKSGKQIRPGKPVATIITLGFANTVDQTLRADVEILFEDEIGINLYTHTCDQVVVRGRQASTERQKVKLQGDLLLATRKVTLTCTVR